MRALRVVLAVLALGAACSSDAFVTPQSDELYVYVPLSPPGDATGDTALYAFVLAAGTPINSPYVTADRFEVRRASDGALLDWRFVQPAKPRVVLANSLLSSDGNYVLPLHGSAGRLGRIDLAPGDRYELLVEAEGITIHGAVTMPGIPQPAFQSTSSLPLLHWSRVTGAGGYGVTTQDFDPTFGFTSDTLYRFDGVLTNISDIGTLVRAFDPQFFAFLADGRVGRAGIDAGFGAFGAYTTASLPKR